MDIRKNVERTIMVCNAKETRVVLHTPASTTDTTVVSSPLQSATDYSPMDIRSKPRNQAGAPQGRPGRRPPTVYSLEEALAEIDRLNKQVRGLEAFKEQSQIEKWSFCQRVHKGEIKTSRLQKSLEVADGRIKLLQGLQETAAINQDKMVAEYEGKLSEQRKENESLSQKLTEFEKQLIGKEAERVQLDKDWKEVNKMVMEMTIQGQDVKKQIWETRMTDLGKLLHEELAKNETLAEANQSQEKVVQQLLTRIEKMDDLANKDLHWQAKAQQLQDENKVLEDICLSSEKRKRGFFGKKMGDRETELENLRKKMLKKEMKKKGKKAETQPSQETEVQQMASREGLAGPDGPPLD